MHESRTRRFIHGCICGARGGAGYTVTVQKTLVKWVSYRNGASRGSPTGVRARRQKGPNPDARPGTGTVGCSLSLCVWFLLPLDPESLREQEDSFQPQKNEFLMR